MNRTRILIVVALTAIGFATYKFIESKRRAARDERIAEEVEAAVEAFLRAGGANSRPAAFVDQYHGETAKSLPKRYRRICSYGRHWILVSVWGHYAISLPGFTANRPLHSRQYPDANYCHQRCTRLQGWDAAPQRPHGLCLASRSCRLDCASNSSTRETRQQPTVFRDRPEVCNRVECSFTMVGNLRHEVHSQQAAAKLRGRNSGTSIRG